MCTVLYIPVNGRFYFASLRDENPARPTAKPPFIESGAGYRFLAPADPLAGGTWAGINSYENVIILLNGGFENHTRTGRYKKSRGLIVNELLKAVYPMVEWSMINMEEVEPYTLVVWSENKLFQLTWDGVVKHRLLLDQQQPAIWSSSTLYTSTVKQKRKLLFDEWISTGPVITQQTVLSFFESFTDDKNGFIMHRSPELKTLSYSFIELIPAEQGIFNYNDFSNSSAVTQVINTSGYIPDLRPLFTAQSAFFYKK